MWDSRRDKTKESDRSDKNWSSNRHVLVRIYSPCENRFNNRHLDMTTIAPYTRDLVQKRNCLTLNGTHYYHFFALDGCSLYLFSLNGLFLSQLTFLLLLGFKASERWAEEAELGCNSEIFSEMWNLSFNTQLSEMMKQWWIKSVSLSSQTWEFCRKYECLRASWAEDLHDGFQLKNWF